MILKRISTESKTLIDAWMRRSATHWRVDQKLSCVTDVYNDGAAADILNLVDFSHAEATAGAPILSDLSALKACVNCKQKEGEAPAAYSERLDELGDKTPAKRNAVKNDDNLAAATLSTK